MHEVFLSVVIAFLMKLAGSAINFIFNIVIARLLGGEGTGLYFMALSITLISSVIGRLGLDNALLRFISIFSANSEWGEVKGVYQLGMKEEPNFWGELYEDDPLPEEKCPRKYIRVGPEFQVDI